MKKSCLTLALVCVATVAAAQGTVEDYKRAAQIHRQFPADKVVGTVSDVRWSDGQTLVYQLHDQPGHNERKQASIAQDGRVTISEVVDRPEQNQGPRGDFGQRGRQQRRDMGRGDWGQQPTTSTKTGPQKLQNHWMNVDEERSGRRVLSPDSAHYAYVRDYNVWVCDAQDRNHKQLSFDGTLSHYYSGYLSWSPDGRYVYVNKIKPVEKRYVYYVESSPTTQTQPILHQQEYAKPGDEVLQRQPHVFEVATGRDISPLETDLGRALCPNAYEMRGPEWADDSRTVTFEYNERGHKAFRVMELNVETGGLRIIAQETSEKYINYNRYYRHYINDGKQMLWMSERDNWTHIYVVDVAMDAKTDKAKGKDGASAKNFGPKEKAKATTMKTKAGDVQVCPIRQITKGEWVVRKVLRVDEENGLLYFTASGVNKDEDPYLIHYYKIGLDGQNMVDLTPGDGNHSAQFNSDYTYLVDTYSKVDTPPVTVLRSVANPEQGTVLGQGDASELVASGFQMPEVFAAPGRDGQTMMWGVVYRPSNYDAQKTYPIIEYIYAGPGDAYTPKNFSTWNGYCTALAELGFIVVQLDAMGTSYRGKSFEEVCYKNLKDAGFPDRIAWIKALSKKYPNMDADNVGIYGCSAGGQESTTAVLLHGDFYKAAYSACGCHDNRMDKIWWNEQWMGYPVDSSYVECSNVTNAHKLERPLMLVVGEMDDNVDPASTMQVANALIKAGKDFELVVIPGAHHTMGESFGEHKRYDFFVRNLWHREPPKWSELK